jgi:hypothetical protein
VMLPVRMEQSGLLAVDVAGATFFVAIVMVDVVSSDIVEKVLTPHFKAQLKYGCANEELMSNIVLNTNPIRISHYFYFNILL